MNTQAPTRGDETAIPIGLRALWQEARDWILWLAEMCSPAQLRTTGVNREYGVRIAIWLRDIEGAVRRLILAAAIALAPPPRRTQNAALHGSRKPVARRASLRIFHLATSAAPRSAPATSRLAPPRPYAHLAFPADPLLRLGAQPRTQPDPSPGVRRARNPLDRHGRLSRLDPDWRAPKEPSYFSAPPERDLIPHERGFVFESFDKYVLKPARGPNDIPASLQDWRRRYDAWTQPIPAPALAARVEALSRAVANPTALIASAARRLRDLRAPTLKYAFAAAPRSRTPRRARHIETAGHTTVFAARCYDALLTHDTS